MAYSAPIERARPSCFLFVIDQSGSMDDKMSGGESKARFVADVLNKTLYQLTIRCKREGKVRPYFDVGVLAYSNTTVQSGFGGELTGGLLQSIVDIEAKPLRVEERTKKTSDGAGGLVDQVTKFPIWFDPVSNGATPMCAALTKAAEVLVGWCDTHKTSYPPTVIHVTDGESTDGDPTLVAETLRQIATEDGQTLLFNLHINTTEGASVVFPKAETDVSDANGKSLFKMSSPFPEHLAKAAKEKGYDIGPESRFFGYKAGYEAIVDFFDIGTRAAQMR